MHDGNPLLIAYDGSKDATAAIRTAARLLRETTAVVVHVRREPFTMQRSNLARVALPDSVIITAAQNYERAAAEAAQATGRWRDHDRARGRAGGHRHRARGPDALARHLRCGRGTRGRPDRVRLARAGLR